MALLYSQSQRHMIKACLCCFQTLKWIIFSMLINVKMPKIVGISTVMSMINFRLGWVEHEFFICFYFDTPRILTLMFSPQLKMHFKISPFIWVYDSLFLKTYAVYLQGPIYNETALANYADKDFFERNKTKVLAQRFGTVEEVYLTL